MYTDICREFNGEWDGSEWEKMHPLDSGVKEKLITRCERFGIPLEVVEPEYEEVDED